MTRLIKKIQLLGALGVNALIYKGGKHLWDSHRENMDRWDELIENDRDSRERIKVDYIRGLENDGDDDDDDDDQ